MAFHQSLNHPANYDEVMAPRHQTIKSLMRFLGGGWGYRLLCFSLGPDGRLQQFRSIRYERERGRQTIEQNFGFEVGRGPGRIYLALQWSPLSD